MHLGSLESTEEARVALGYASSNSYASLVLSKLPVCIHNSVYTHAKHEPILKWLLTGSLKSTREAYELSALQTSQDHP